MASPPPESESLRAKSVAKWGAACAQCASAKAKCLRSNNTPGAKCDRCDRLFKDCTVQVHRPRKRRITKPSRTAQLEQRLNGLVNLLRASGELHFPLPNDSEGKEDQEEIPPEELESTFRAAACISNDHDFDVVDTQQRNPPPESPEDDMDGGLDIPPTFNCNAPELCICRSKPGPAPPPPDSDENLLAIYQAHLSPLLPFVIVPAGTDPAELEAKKPFLMATIRMVSSLNSMRSMRAQMYRLMQQLTENMMMRSERSMDLLQGIIVIIGWYQHHCLMHAQLNNLTHLAHSLVADLGLNKHAHLAEKVSLMMLYPDEPSPRTNEERRALLGVWFLTSCLARIFGKIESLRYSSYIQQCLRELEQAHEYDSDVILVAMVRLQHLTEDVAEITSREGEGHGETGILKAPVSAYMSAFQKELDTMRDDLPKFAISNPHLQVAFHTATLHLYEPPLIDSALLTKFQNDLARPATNSNATSALDVFYRAHGALKGWLDHWLYNVPVSTYHYFPVSTSTQVIYAVTMLGRWAKLLVPIKKPRNPAFPRAPTANGSSTSENERRTSTTSASGASGTSGLGSGRASTSGTSPDPLPGQNPMGGEQSAMVRPSPGMLANIKWRPTADPVIPEVVAALKQQLLSQPGLALDFADILEKFAARFQQAARELREANSNSEPDEPSLWELGLKKCIITKVKLERWAEIVANGETSGGGTAGARTGSVASAATTTKEDGGEDVGMRIPSEQEYAAHGATAVSAAGAQPQQQQLQLPGGRAGGNTMTASVALAGLTGFNIGLPVELEGFDMAAQAAAFPSQVDPALGLGGADPMACLPSSFDPWQTSNVWSTDLFPGMAPAPAMWADPEMDWTGPVNAVDKDMNNLHMNGNQRAE